MRLTSLVIENFRGITRLEVDFDSDITVILGQNNTGKTAVLEAIASALDPRVGVRAQTPRFNTWDFRVDALGQQQASFTLTFLFKEAQAGEWTADTVASVSEAVQTEAGVGGAVGLRSVRFRVTGTLSGSNVDHQAEFLDLRGQVIAKARSAVSAFRRLRPAFYMPALRDASREFARNATYWTPFIRDNAIDSATRAQLEIGIRKVNDEVIAAHTPFAKAKAHIGTIGKTVDSNARSDLRFDPFPPRLGDLLGRTQVAATSPDGAWVPLERHGEGTQSTAVLLLFRAYCESQLAEAMDNDEALPIICIEEPEAHLHPNAARALWAELRALPGQKIIATHSGDVVSRAFPTYLRRLPSPRPGVARSVGRVTSVIPTTKGGRALQTRVRMGRGDMLFARLWLLGEGETEVILFDGAAEVLGYDLDQLGVVVVAYRDESLEAYLDLADELGIAWFVIPDQDRQGKDDEAKARARIARGARGGVGSLPSSWPEEYLWTNGFKALYEGLVPSGARAQLPATTDRTYPERVIATVANKVGKPGAAKAVVDEMRVSQDVPDALKAAVEACITFLGSL